MFATSRSTLTISALLLGGAVLVTARGASAQEQLQAPTGAAAQASSSGLEEIVVTARKRVENVQNIPVAVTALTGAKLEQYDLASLEGIAAATPQLTVVRGSSGSGADLSLRGIGSNFTSIGIEQSVAVNIDGVYYGQGRIINEGFFDMRQVEIYKGPQALFYGKNATAGAIAFTSADPGDTFQAMGRFGYEFTSEQKIFEGYVSGPINDKIALRLAVRGTDMSGGYVENLAPATTYTTVDVANGFAPTNYFSPSPQRDVPAEGDLVGRLTAKFTPNDDLTITLKGAGDRYRVTDATWNNELVYCPSGTAQVNPGENCNKNWKIQNNNVPSDVAATNSILSKHGGELYQDYDSYSFTGTANYVLDDVFFNWVNGYHHFENFFLGDYDVTGAANGGTWGAERSEYHAYSSEFRAQTTLDFPVNVMVGGYYQNTRLDFNQDVLFPGGLENSALGNSQNRYVTLEKASATDGETFAGFAQAIWKFLPGWELTAGMRYTHETKDSFFIQPYVVSAYQSVFVQGQYLRANQSFNNVSPEATVTWKPDSDLTLYAAYKQGYKSGGFSGSALYSTNTTVGDLAFGPEKVRGFEIGAKSTWLDGKLRLNADAYVFRYTGLQVDFFDASKIQYTTFNAGAATVRGIEADAEWAPKDVPGLILRANANFNQARYSSFGNAPCYSGQTPAEGCTIGPDGRAFQNLTGSATALAPRWTGSVEADYSTPFNGNLVFGVSGIVHYSGSYMLDAFDIPVDRQAGYATFDSTIRIGSDDDLWQVALIGKNLSNAYVLYGAYDAPSSGGGTGTAGGFHSDQVGFPGNPRTVELQVTLRY